MKKQRLGSLRNYLALVVRCRWIMVLVTFMALGLSLLVTFVFPKIYVSETMILIRPREVPTDFVKDLITGNTDQRLTAIEQTILSRTNLLRILDEFGSTMTGYDGLNSDRRVLKLKSGIAIDFPSERVRGQWLPTTNIRISCRDQNPALAQKIAARLTDLFIEQDNRAREAMVFGTTEFLAAEVNKVQAQLQESETRLKTLKERYRYELPTELDSNLRTLDRLQLQKTANLEALDRHVTMQMNLERQIAETPAVISRESATRGAPTAIRPQGNPLVEDYRRKEREYRDLIGKWTENHPEVRRAKADLERLRQEIPPQDLASVDAASDAAASAVTEPNPVYQNLTAQLRQVRTEIDIREREKKSIEVEMARYSQRVQNTPRNEQEIAEVQRRNEELIKQHEDLKSKLAQARLAESLESRQKGAQFEVIDRANYPLEPATPRLAVILLVGLLISVALGVAAAVAAGVLSPKIWTQRELERALETPVLVEIPKVPVPADTRLQWRRRFAQAALFLIFAGVYAGGLLYLYRRPAPVTTLLTPLAERIAKRAS